MQYVVIFGHTFHKTTAEAIYEIKQWFASPPYKLGLVCIEIQS